MKVIHIIGGISRASGGPARSSQALVAALNLAGCEAWLLSCRPGEEAWIDGVEHFEARKEGESYAAFYERMIARVRPDVIHIHATWLWCLHVAARVARKHQIPYVIAPRGSLDPWSLAQKKWKKWLAMWLYQRRDLASAAALHATAASEAGYLRGLGFRQAIILSPNGVVTPDEKSWTECRQANEKRKDGKRRALFVSRMHQKKGVLELVEAWARLPIEVRKDWCVELVYTCFDEVEKEYEAQVKARVRELGLEGDFIFTGALVDERKWEAYRRADLFVLPTHTENFGIVIAEALWAGLPVITTTGAPWGELETWKCGWWIEFGVEALVGAMQEALSLTDEEREQMGERGQKLIEEKYQWPAIGRQMYKAYEGMVKK